MRPNVRKYWVTAGDMTQLFQSGEVLAGEGWPLMTNQLRQAKFPAGETIPKEGTTAWADHWVLTKGAKNLDAAYAWLEYSAQPFTQKLLYDVTAYIVANPDARNYMSPEQAASQRDISDYGSKVNFWQWSPRRREVSEIWNEVKTDAMENSQREGRGRASCLCVLPLLLPLSHRSPTWLPSTFLKHSSLAAVNDLVHRLREVAASWSTPNSAKTTTLRMIGENQQPTEGDLEKIIETRAGAKGIGFGATIRSKRELEPSNQFQEVMPEDLVKFGMIPEFIGRLPVITSVHNLDREALLQILIEPRNALVKQYQRLFELDGVELDFEREALEAIADQAILRQTGARGLRAIMEEVLMSVMYEVPSRKDVARVVITADVVLSNVEPDADPAGRPRRQRPGRAEDRLIAPARRRGPGRPTGAPRFVVVGACSGASGLTRTRSRSFVVMSIATSLVMLLVLSPGEPWRSCCELAQTRTSRSTPSWSAS